jgi:hypothetical protein
MTKEQLGKVRVFNSCDFAGEGNVYIAYHGAEARRCYVAGWRVYRVGYRLEEKEWGDSPKLFMPWHDKNEALAKAKAWASAEFGIEEWAKAPFGVWMDARVLKQRMAELKRKLKELESTEAGA